MTFDISVLAIGAFILVAGLLSKWLERHWIPPTVFALLTGFLLGPHASGLLDLDRTGHRAHIFELVARLSLGLSIISLALFVPKKFNRNHAWDLIKLLVLSMALMWVIGTTITYFTLGIPLLLAALIAATFTPTDPVAARPIISGAEAKEGLPNRIRYILGVEAAANGALAYLFVFLPFLLLTLPISKVPPYFLLHTLLYEVVAGTLIGLLLGLLAGQLLKKAEAASLVDMDWRLVSTAALALTAVALGHLLHVDELMLAFGAGCAFTQVVTSKERKHEEHGHEAVNRFLSIPLFGLFGMMLPIDQWRELGWRGAALVAGLLLFRRLPVFLLIRPALGFLKHRRDAVFLGWFGPIGVDTIYYATLMEQRLQDSYIWTVASLVILCSILVHAITATPFTRLYNHYRKKDPHRELTQTEKQQIKQRNKKRRQRARRRLIAAGKAALQHPPRPGQLAANPPIPFDPDLAAPRDLPRPRPRAAGQSPLAGGEGLPGQR